MPIWLTLLTILAVWFLFAVALGLLIARHIHRSPPAPLHTARMEEKPFYSVEDTSVQMATMVDRPR
ncbi:hypothetical protein [Streptomyces sp. NPDC054865]